MFGGTTTVLDDKMCPASCVSVWYRNVVVLVVLLPGELAPDRCPETGECWLNVVLLAAYFSFITNALLSR